MGNMWYYWDNMNSTWKKSDYKQKASFSILDIADREPELWDLGGVENLREFQFKGCEDL